MLSPAGVCLLGSICLMRAIRLFIAEGEGAKGKASGAQGTGTSEKAPQESVTYQVPEPPSALVREEEFAKQLRLARYLAASSLPPSRPLEPALKARAPKQGSDPPQRRGLKPRQNQRGKRPGRRNWRRRGGGWVGRRRRPLVQVGAKTSGVRLGAKPDYGIAEASRAIRLPWTGFLADGTFTSFDAPQPSSSALSVTILRFRATPPSYHTIDLAVRLT